MKSKLIALLGSLLLWGCSPKEPAADADAIKPAPAKASAPVSPPARRKFKMVEDADTKEQKEIRLQALTLFTNKDYQGLDALAAKYRASQEAYADGSWKLGSVYWGAEPEDDAPRAEWQARLAQVNDWIQTRENSITARVTKARLLVGYAWEIRGGGWADSVKQTQWKEFSEQLQQAARTLRAAQKIPERCPLYWSTWQRVALGLQMEKAEYNAIFAAAVKEFPDYWYFHCVRSVYLLPRWNGEEGEWERELTVSANRIGGEIGDMIYAQTVWDTHHYGGGIDVFAGKRISWERVDKGFAGLLKKFPDSESAKNERAFLAALAGDKARARDYFQQLNGEAVVKIWDDQKRVDQFLNWVFAP